MHSTEPQTKLHLKASGMSLKVEITKVKISCSNSQQKKKKDQVLLRKINMQGLINHLNSLSESQIITIKHENWTQTLIMVMGGMAVGTFRPLK